MPRKTEQNQKKGNPSWKPASLLTTDKVQGYRLRWLDKDPANLDKKRREGWQFVSEINAKGTHDNPETIQDGKPLTSVTEYRELVLAAMPEDMAQGREEYFRDRTKAQTAGLLNDAKELNQEVEERSGKSIPKHLKPKLVIE